MAISAILLMTVQNVSAQAETPMMGWNSWDLYGCDINEDKIKAMADSMVDKQIFGNGTNISLLDMGFNYLVIDDCWMGRARNATGWIDASLNRFPGGIGVLIDYIHVKGLLVGLTMSAGTKTCAGKPGSLGYEQQDAVLLAEWQVDLLKYDDCYNTGVPAETRHKAMSYAINGTGREEFNCLITVSNWGNEGVWDWASDFAHSWRTGPDIAIGDRSKTNIWFQMVRNFRINLEHADKAGPGHWNDPDMLVLHYADLTPQEARTHWALWCFSKAPLILSMDLRQIGNYSQDDSIAYVIHNSSEILKVNQDQLGKQAVQVQVDDSTGKGYDLQYFKTLVEDPDTNVRYDALLVVNFDDNEIADDVDIDLSKMGIALSSFDKCTLTNMWTAEVHKRTGGKQPIYTKGLKIHDHLAYKINCSPF